ncbi:MAG: von Willebrand factor type protein [Fibrobacteres bacterium]|nr:von Willebrand factor type protein [Fibrobacterota bacterium]
MEIRYGMPLPGEEGGEGDGKVDLVDLFSQLFLRSNGDVRQALEWLRRIAERQGWLDRERTFEDMLDELEEKGVLKRDKDGFEITPAGDKAVRESVFERVFKGMGKGLRGNHNTGKLGRGGERQAETRPYSFGDELADLDFNATIRNSLQRGGKEADFSGDWQGLPTQGLSEEDFEVHEREQLASCSTVLMLDISHSMILYGENRITPAKMVAMSLVEFVKRHYPRDTLDVITFGDEAKEIPADRIAHVSVGPFHTNTCDGLRLAQTLLRKRKNTNKQIFMVTDGKPSAVFDRGRLYRNSFGLDPLVLQKTFAEGRACRKNKIRVCTFMVAQDPYLIEFVEEFSKVCAGKAFYTGLDGLGEFVFTDYAAHRRGKVR